LKKEITPYRDARNKRLIACSLRALLGLGLSAERQGLLSIGTPEDRAEFIKNNRIHCALVLAYGAIFLFAISLQVPPFKTSHQPLLLSSMAAAGQIQSLQLHQTTFSTSTTVVTSTGSYQVEGGVSAKSGDEASLKQEKDTLQKITRTSLCVDSKIQSRCFVLL
jgi:hypothetical protein